MKSELCPIDRLQRMQAMFAAGSEILLEDYKYFARFKPDGSTAPNTGRRKSETPPEPRGQGRN